MSPHGWDVETLIFIISYQLCFTILEPNHSSIKLSLLLVLLSLYWSRITPHWHRTLANDMTLFLVYFMTRMLTGFSISTPLLDMCIRVAMGQENVHRNFIVKVREFREILNSGKSWENFMLRLQVLIMTVFYGQCFLQNKF